MSAFSPQRPDSSQYPPIPTLQATSSPCTRYLRQEGQRWRRVRESRFSTIKWWGTNIESPTSGSGFTGCCCWASRQTEPRAFPNRVQRKRKGWLLKIRIKMDKDRTEAVFSQHPTGHQKDSGHLRTTRNLKAKLLYLFSRFSFLPKPPRLFLEIPVDVCIPLTWRGECVKDCMIFSVYTPGIRSSDLKINSYHHQRPTAYK